MRNALLVQKSTADQMDGSDRFSSEEKVKTMTARDPMKALPKARLVSIKLCMHEFSIVLTDIMYTLYISLFSI